MQFLAGNAGGAELERGRTSHQDLFRELTANERLRIQKGAANEAEAQKTERIRIQEAARAQERAQEIQKLRMEEDARRAEREAADNARRAEREAADKAHTQEMEKRRETQNAFLVGALLQNTSSQTQQLGTLAQNNSTLARTNSTLTSERLNAETGGWKENDRVKIGGKGKHQSKTAVIVKVLQTKYNARVKLDDDDEEVNVARGSLEKP